MKFTALDTPETHLSTPENIQFCCDFRDDDSAPKYVLGRNMYAESVSKAIPVQGFIDDYTSDTAYLGRPILKLADVPGHALVLNVAGGRPLSARRRLDEAGLRSLDYFAFCKLSGLDLVPIRFNEGFEEEFVLNWQRYDWIHGLLADELSKEIFEKLVRFRFTYDIAYLEGFSQRESVQYFEDFLDLRLAGETFVDIGAYDGFTSLEFAKRCPQYKAIHAFEPDPSNFLRCEKAMERLANVHCYPFGVSRSKATLNFDMQGSSSRVSEGGGVTISVERLDEVLQDPPTFIKMDIEGGEPAAIEGARETILAHHPRLAIAAYHAAGDFWRIPDQILSIRDDYDVYMRHYTECIYETVLFFVPRA